MGRVHISHEEIEGITNSSTKIHVREFRNSQWAIFAIYYKGRCWKRLRPIRDNGLNADWLEFTPNGYKSVSIKREAWLDRVWRNSDEYPQLRRYPRRDLEGERLMIRLGAAFGEGNLDTVALTLQRISEHLGISGPHSATSSALTWETVPRFNPAVVPETKWLIDHFLAERSIQLVFGERGSFKSTLLLGAAMAVSRGIDFLGMGTRQRRVLFLDYENPAHVIKNRNDDFGLDLPTNPFLAVWDRFGKHPVPRPMDIMLETFVRQTGDEMGHGPWLIFDSWASLLRPGEGGENTGQIAPLYMDLRKLTDLGATVPYGYNPTPDLRCSYSL
jgi:hypothetical protein